MKQKYKYSNVLLNSLLDPKGFNLQEKFTKDSPELWIISHEHYKEIFSTKTIIKEPQKNESEPKKEYRFSKTKGNENNYSQEDKSGVRIQYSNIQGNEGTIQRERKYYKYSTTSGNNEQVKEEKLKSFEYNEILLTEIRKQQQGKTGNTNYDDEFHSII